MNILRKLFTVWTAFARFIGTVNTMILLSVLFILVVTPVGLLMRIFGKNVLVRPRDRSSWVRRSGDEDLRRQY